MQILCRTEAGEIADVGKSGGVRPGTQGYRFGTAPSGEKVTGTNVRYTLETSLELVREHKQQFGEPARKIMVDIFQLLPNDSELTSTYRRKLAAALY